MLMEKWGSNGDGGKCLIINSQKKKEPTEIQVLAFASFHHVNTPAYGWFQITNVTDTELGRGAL